MVACWTSRVVAGTACCCWHRVFLLVPCVLAGSACCCWHHGRWLRLRASCAIAGIMHGRWYRVLLLAPCVLAGTACCYWALRVIAGIMVADIAGYCGHRVLLLASFRVTGLTENPDRLFVGKFICQSRPDRGLLKQESVPNRVPDTVYRSRSDHRPELSFWQSGTDRTR